MARRSTAPSPEQIATQIARDKLEPAYLVYGPDQYRAMHLIRAIRTRALCGSPAGFNHDQVSAASSSGDRIVGLCRTLPMMADRRLVEVLDSDRLDDTAADRLARYLEDPVPEAVLLLRAAKMDARTRLYKTLKAGAVVVKCDGLAPRELPVWIENQARVHQVSLGTGVADLILEVAGTDLGILDSTLEKLSLFVSPRTQIQVEDVDQAISRTRSVTAFELADAVLERDLIGGLRSLQALLGASKGRDAEFQALGMVAWQVRRLLRARDLLAGAVKPTDICRELRVPTSLNRRFMTRVRAVRGADLLRAHAELFKADELMKSTGKVGGRAALEALVVRLCTPGPRPDRR